jgi:xanthine dehydrogenase accessory factor
MQERQSSSRAMDVAEADERHSSSFGDDHQVTGVLHILRELTTAIEQRRPVALATVVTTDSSVPAQAGFKLLVYPDGTKAGNAGGGALEEHVRLAALQALEQGTARQVHYTLTEEGPDATGMLCGGEVTVFVEPYIPKPILLLVGGGHVGRPLADLARVLEYDLRIVDVRADRATDSQLDPATITPDTYVVLITENHETDEQTLRRVIDTPAAYVGMIGSRRKVEAILGHLRAEGVLEAKLSQVHAPIGLDLGGRKPQEIALAILAEIEMVRHGGSHWPRSLGRPNQNGRPSGNRGASRPATVAQ